MNTVLIDHKKSVVNNLILKLSGFLVFLLISCEKPPKKPNIVFIVVDDLGWTDLGYMGSSFYETPNIDAFSKSSIQFTDAYASASVCSPTRASILTGKHPARLNITDWIPGDDNKNYKLVGPEDLSELPLGEMTIADILKENGYSTFFAGKWHLGGEGFLPQNQGFDVNIGGYHMGQPPGGYYSPYKNPYLTDGPEGEYLTDRLTDESMNYIDTIGDKPFFLYLSYYTVHTPIQANKQHVERFKQKLKKLPSDKPTEVKDGDAVTNVLQRNADYASMLFSLDENIGRFIEKLKEKGLYENTIIVFTSDNGGLTTLKENLNYLKPTAVVPLRAGKGWLYEGGVRVPLIIKPANYAGGSKIVSDPVISHDFFPTLISQTQIPMPSDSTIDGVDLTPLFTGNHIQRDAVFWHYPHYHGSGWTPGAAIRQRNWKLIEFYETETFELYDLSKDISEQNNLLSKYPEKAESLKNKLYELQTATGAKMPTYNSNFKD